MIDGLPVARKAYPSTGCWNVSHQNHQEIDGGKITPSPEQHLMVAILLDSIENIQKNNSYAAESRGYLQSIPPWVVDFLDLSSFILKELKKM